MRKLFLKPFALESTANLTNNQIIMTYLQSVTLSKTLPVVFTMKTPKSSFVAFNSLWYSIVEQIREPKEDQKHIFHVFAKIKKSLQKVGAVLCSD